MREILFRGKPKQETEYYFFSQNWEYNCKDGFVCGSLIVSKDRYYICVSALCNIKCCVNNGMTSMIEVIPETVGQFTGKIDKNGTKIFEGDVVAYDNKYSFIVKWDNEYCGFYAKMMEFNDYDYLGNFWSKLSKVIGNIHDNPELLEG